MTILRMAVVISVLALDGCVTSEPGALVGTTLGDRPVVCYVYARRTHVLVPISCAQAQLLY
jgi:hypothetical protein